VIAYDVIDGVSSDVWQKIRTLSFTSKRRPRLPLSPAATSLTRCFPITPRRHKRAAPKGDLAIRPIYHQIDERIEAHIFVAFLAYCLQVTLKYRLKSLAPGLTPRAALEKLAPMQMVDVRLPTTDGRVLILPRYTQPDPDQQLLLSQLKLTLPEQPPPRIQSQDARAA
jgi:hypothetical protein